MQLHRRTACAIASALLAIIVAEPLKAGETETIEVYADAPIGPAHGDAQRAVGNGQSLDSEDLTRPGNRAIGDALQELGSVFATDATGNPFQPDLFYRGYSISPLLGLPQGIAVYQDGVRVNEAFGDTVNFDLIPLIALSRADLVPGSNPVFGRNTLGGALALTTKTGFDAKGVGVEMNAGEFGRRGLSAEVGVAGDTLALYLSGELFKEHGWRDFSESRASRVFARGTWLPDAATQLDLSLTAADNRLRGNGATPIDLIEEEGRDAVFTHDDQTRPKLAFLNFNGSHKLDDGATLSLGTYFRRNRTRGFNGDGTEYQACEDPAHVDGTGQAFLCEIGDDGEDVVQDRDGNPVVAGDGNDSATRNRSYTRQDSYGLSAQIEKPVGAHRLLAGGSVDFGRIEFTSDSELGQLTASRGTIGSGVFVADSRVDLHADNDGVGVYLMDTWRATTRLELVAAGRWNRTTIELRDQVPDGDLSGRHHFDRFNPMLGGSFTLVPHWTAFGSASQSTRAPTPVELTCANPDDPCRLPNGFVDDPPLDEVVTLTAELGLRHRSARGTGSIAVFRAISKDDILFITDGDLTNTGYFDNVGKTLRQGVELALEAPLGAGFSAGLQFTALTAEFREAFLVNSPNHPLRDPGDDALPDPSTRQVHKGDRIPLIPRVQGRATLGWSNPRFDVDLEALGRGNSRYRGDEANVDSQEVAGFVLVNASVSWKLAPQLSLFANVDNLFDRDFETFGVYGEGGGVLGAGFENSRRFVGVGAPRIFEAGVRMKF